MYCRTTLVRSALVKGLNALDGALAATTPRICFGWVMGLSRPETKNESLPQVNKFRLNSRFASPSSAIAAISSDRLRASVLDRSAAGADLAQLQSKLGPQVVRLGAFEQLTWAGALRFFNDDD